MKKKIAIIGAGIAGLTLANLLKVNSNFEFVVYEKGEVFNFDEGFGVQLSVNGIKILNIFIYFLSCICLVSVYFQKLQDIYFLKLLNFQYK